MEHKVTKAKRLFCDCGHVNQVHGKATCYAKGCECGKFQNVREESWWLKKRQRVKSQLKMSLLQSRIFLIRNRVRYANILRPSILRERIVNAINQGAGAIGTSVRLTKKES